MVRREIKRSVILSEAKDHTVFANHTSLIA